MKYLSLTCGILAVVLSQANAQVSKSDFVGNINALSSYISQNNQNGEKVSLVQLSAFMRAQGLYLEKTINASTATYTADTTKANADLRAATKANIARQKVYAQDELRKAQEELPAINQYRNNLTTDNTLFASISTLSRNISANKDALIAALNQYAATLQ